MPADNDSDSVKPGGESTRILEQARVVPDFAVSVPFPDMKHGWVTRGDDTKDGNIARDQADALRRCAEFILEHAGAANAKRLRVVSFSAHQRQHKAKVIFLASPEH